MTVHHGDNNITDKQVVWEVVSLLPSRNTSHKTNEIIVHSYKFHMQDYS